MSDINVIVISGNVGQDPEIKASPNGQSIMSFSVATNRFWRDQNKELQQQTDWHRVTVYGKTADSLAKVLAKGRKVTVQGSIRNNVVEKDGKKTTYTNIIADTVSVALPPKGNTDLDEIPFG